jgi:hypothetical protein
MFLSVAPLSAANVMRAVECSKPSRGVGQDDISSFIIEGCFHPSLLLLTYVFNLHISEMIPSPSVCCSLFHVWQILNGEPLQVCHAPLILIQSGNMCLWIGHIHLTWSFLVQWPSMYLYRVVYRLYLARGHLLCGHPASICTVWCTPYI